MLAEPRGTLQLWCQKWDALPSTEHQMRTMPERRVRKETDVHVADRRRKQGHEVHTWSFSDV